MFIAADTPAILVNVCNHLLDFLLLWLKAQRPASTQQQQQYQYRSTRPLLLLATQTQGPGVIMHCYGLYHSHKNNQSITAT
jgi:hypothetical protein